MFKPGWLERQFEKAKTDVAKLPVSLQRDIEQEKKSGNNNPHTSSKESKAALPKKK